MVITPRNSMHLGFGISWFWCILILLLFMHTLYWLLHTHTYCCGLLKFIFRQVYSGKSITLKKVWDYRDDYLEKPVRHRANKQDSSCFFLAWIFATCTFIIFLITMSVLSYIFANTNGDPKVTFFTSQFGLVFLNKTFTNMIPADNEICKVILHLFSCVPDSQVYVMAILWVFTVGNITYLLILEESNVPWLNGISDWLWRQYDRCFNCFYIGGRFLWLLAITMFLLSPYIDYPEKDSYTLVCDSHGILCYGDWVKVMVLYDLFIDQHGFVWSHEVILTYDGNGWVTQPYLENYGPNRPTNRIVYMLDLKHAFVYGPEPDS